MIAKYTNGVTIGEYVLNEDGYYVFFPEKGSFGYWNESFLMYVLLQLRRLNIEWDTQVITDPRIAGAEVDGVNKK